MSDRERVRGRTTPRRSLPRRDDPAAEGLDDTTRTLLFLLLLLVVAVVLGAAMMFSANSRVFLLKSTAAALLAIIPGWIFLQFLRHKGPSLYDEYVLNLFRLRIDAIANLPAPPQHTTWYPLWHAEHRHVVPAEVTDNLYRRKFESVYGTSSVSTIGLVTRGRKLRFKECSETFGPVVMATLVLALGWTLVLQPELLRDVDLFGTRLVLSGRPVLPAEALRFAFLGGYSFIVLDLVRRYFRDDLKSAAYVSATVRIIFASALVVAADAAGLQALAGEQQASVVAFFVGFFPRAGFTWLRSLLPSRLQVAVPSLEGDYPLRHLEGLNIWYESRLIEEGIESLQNLCSANLVDLMLMTRLPIVRVVDWLDQAFLYLHLPTSDTEPGQLPPAVAELRRLGIRTATDLEQAWARREEAPALRPLLGKALIPSAPEAVDAVMATLLSSFAAEPNLWHVRAFRGLSWLREAEDRVVDLTTATGAGDLALSRR
ncbi:MAG TPA: hypothetical protein VIK95_07415 [Egibacteraceae bacterium]